MNKETKTRLIQIGLFILTLTTTTLAGAEWMFSKYVFYGLTWEYFVKGFEFSLPFLGILTVHEFGHYFTARYHQVKVSLPYYIPFWFGFVPGLSIGTMGAFIRIREHISSRVRYFDIGISGPIAGFVIAVGVLWYGFTHLPPWEYVYQIHPEYGEFASVDQAIKETDGLTIRLGRNLLFSFFEAYVADSDLLPHKNEMIHYPWLLAGYLALFFTALNLLPVGQLDGGHVLFGLFGPKGHAVASRILFSAFVFYAGLGWISVNDLVDLSLNSLGRFLVSLTIYVYVLYICAFNMFKEPKNKLLFATAMLATQFVTNLFFQIEGYIGWLLFSVLIGRFLGIDHPPVQENETLSPGRKILGWIALIIFILCFSPQPLILEVPTVPGTP